MSDSERSLSRGRDCFQSSGRGGVGNIRRNSLSSDERLDGPDDSSCSRRLGRGGADNFRSPSCSPSRGSCKQEREVLSCAVEREGVAPHSTGSGGLENIIQSVSRDSPHPPNCDSKSLVHEGKTSEMIYEANPERYEDGELWVGAPRADAFGERMRPARRKHIPTLAADSSLKYAPSTYIKTDSTGRGGEWNITSTSRRQ
ncbi:hypothetical protein BDQ17DRAFT_1384968 [Cyathus striatus]|nr:hypothetical protein BDQ17DRAFT_1384968 [Cyathus striatus]